MNKICDVTRLVAMSALAFAIAALLLLGAPVAGANNIPLGGAGNFSILYEGGGSGNQLSITNVTINGNVGVGGSGAVAFSGPGTINGALDFSASNTGQFSNSNGSNVGPTSVTYSAGAVAAALNLVNGLNSTFGSASGTNININLSGSTTLTINESSGTLVNIGGVNYRVFNVTGFNTTNGNTINIVGDGSGDSVIFNFTGNANFNNQVKLTGLTSNQVLWNFVGGSGLTGGPTLQINDNGHGNPGNLVQGIFLDPNGNIQVVNSNVLGDIFGGGSQNMQIVSGDTITQAPVTVVPEPSSLALFATGLLGLVAFSLRKLNS
jgi:hypothetical protein